MLWFYILVCVLLTAILAVQIYWVWFVRKAQQQFQQEQRAAAPTIWDVREMLLEGDKDLAVQLYCEVFDIEDIEKARKEVDELERGLKF